MADQEVDTWVRNTTPAVTPIVTTTPGGSSDIEGSGPTSKPLGGTATQFLQLDIPNPLPLPFPLPNDFLRMEENVPRAGVPSIYLQRRCPICFSGKLNLRTSAYVLISKVYTSTPTDISTSAQAIVCVDANFAQRRRRSRHPDPVVPHPDTHFLSECDVESMKRAVEHARPPDSRANATLGAALPDDILDDCEKAFTAAQGHIAKSSNTIYADTALMALLCRHDRPLFLVNMTSAGERQYYALALIKALFRQLPDDWVIGLLYDVACHLERSMRKVRASAAIAGAALSQALARLLARIYRSNNICSLGIPCLWPSVGMSTRLPPAQIQRLWPVRWGGLRTTLERNSENDTFSPLSWGMYTATSIYLTSLEIIVLEPLVCTGLSTHLV